jgi:hypothetical protein
VISGMQSRIAIRSTAMFGMKNKKEQKRIKKMYKAEEKEKGIDGDD